MRLQFPALAVTLVLLTLSAAAQQSPTIAAQPDTIYISADGRFETSPDTARIQFSISAQENTSKAAYERASAAAEQIRQLLRSNGIDTKQAEIGFFSLNPVYDYKTAKRKLIAYRVNSSVLLRLKDFSKVAPILQQLAEMDVTSNQTLNYALENMDAAKIRAVEDAYRRARAEADALARAGGRTLGEMSYGAIDALEAVPIRPIAMMARGQAMDTAAPPPTQEFTPQQMTVTARVTVLFTIK
jgi:uncharacterized protein YggE